MFKSFQILQSEGESQMSIITQASNALSLCRSTKEFYGSAEQVNNSSNKLRWYFYYLILFEHNVDSSFRVLIGL
jgi:hypothetical protein